MAQNSAEAGEPAPRPHLPESPPPEHVELDGGDQQQHVHPQQEGGGADDPEGEIAVASVVDAAVVSASWTASTASSAWRPVSIPISAQ